MLAVHNKQFRRFGSRWTYRLSPAFILSCCCVLAIPCLPLTCVFFYIHLYCTLFPLPKIGTLPLSVNHLAFIIHTLFLKQGDECMRLYIFIDPWYYQDSRLNKIINELLWTKNERNQPSFHLQTPFSSKAFWPSRYLVLSTRPLSVLLPVTDTAGGSGPGWP